MSYKYARLVAHALETPWAITPEMLSVVFEILRFRASGGRLTAEELRARIGDDDDSPRPTARRDGVVAVIPIWGVIAHRNFEASSGMTSTEFISAALRRALADDEVKSILLDVSSPGGTVEGVPELADAIFEARGVKPVTALTNAMNGSAAYYLSSQAHEIVSTPSGETGSIGVYGLHEDWSGWLEKEGIRITAFQVGDKKLEGAPWAPLDDDAKAFYKARVDEAGRLFHAAVARGRNVSVADVKKNFGQGRMFSAKDAMKAGMIDRVATFEETIARLAAARPRRLAGTRADAGEFEIQAEAAADSVEASTEPPAAPEPASDQAARDRDDIDIQLALTE